MCNKKTPKQSKRFGFLTSHILKVLYKKGERKSTIGYFNFRRKQLKEVGLDGIAITVRNSVEGEALNIVPRDDVIVVPGLEISSRIGFKMPV